MSNLETKFKNWQERMSQKTEHQKHRYALTVAIFFTCIVLFFVASNWYFQIFGTDFHSSFFSDIENLFSAESVVNK